MGIDLGKCPGIVRVFVRQLFHDFHYSILFLNTLIHSYIRNPFKYKVIDPSNTILFSCESIIKLLFIVCLLRFMVKFTFNLLVWSEDVFYFTSSQSTYQVENIFTM